MKRKPSRRANTAERRATHNAVERQRRETLNGRFLVCRLRFFRPSFPCSSLASTHTYLRVKKTPTGPRRPPPKPNPNPPPLQILHRQQQHRAHPRLPTPPPPRRT
ncbi:hypothetical protein M413DRAFT_78167 [Hebeloma cylindrosporum]|uniref:BHLH domain-containing protein n=1 Tax=Hebeloma cylindrosporum TaxID=76867 RepID=A0A0C3BIE1_HEBCY|nr:hypothetical protein M413DRAFT_78167 [Hebeloma cylindrosporum h7]